MQATSESSREALYSVEEAVYGVLNDTPVFKRLRKTSVKLALSKEGFTSEEADPRRQIRDFRHGNKQVGGEIGFELSYGSFDDQLEALLFSEDWAPRLEVTSSAISAAASDDSYNGVGLPVFTVGEKLTVSGFATGGNNGTKTVVTSTTVKLVVAEALTDEAVGEEVTIETVSESIKAGIKRRSFSLMRHFEDQEDGAAEPYHITLGWMWGAFSLTVAPGGVIKGTFSGLGRDVAFGETAPAGSTLGTPTSSRMFDSFSGWLKEGGVTIANVTEISLNLDNGLQPLFVCFDDKTLEPSAGRSNATGQITAHFKDTSLLRKFVDETPSSLVFKLIDRSGNAYIFTLPNISYTGGQVDTATEGPILLPMPFQAIADAILDSQIQIERIPA